MLIVYPRTNKQNQKKKRKVEPPTPQVTPGGHTLSPGPLPPSQGYGIALLPGKSPPKPAGPAGCQPSGAACMEGESRGETRQQDGVN